MANDRDERLRTAEKAVRQGRIDAAIAEYTALVTDQVNDLSSLNALGDLLVRAGRSPDALPFSLRVADSYLREGFYSKAAGFYRKVLKFSPGDEVPALRLAEALAAQGLLVEAKAQFTTLAQARRKRGDDAGLEEILFRVMEIAPQDVSARLELGRWLAGKGDPRAPGLLSAAADQLQERGHLAEALAVVREIVAADPGNARRRAELVRALLDAGDVEGARSLLSSEAVGDDRVLMRQSAELLLRAGSLEEAKAALARWLAVDPAARADIAEFGRGMDGLAVERRYLGVEVAVDEAVAKRDYDVAAAMLQEFVAAYPGTIPALLRLLDVCVDGGIEGLLEVSQAQLAEAYRAAGMLNEARLVAEDLVLRDPEHDQHRALLRRTLEALGDPDPDAAIDALFDLESEDETDGEGIEAMVPAEVAGPEPPGPDLEFRGSAVPATELAASPPVEPIAVQPVVFPVRLDVEPVPVKAIPVASEVDLSGALDALTSEEAGDLAEEGEFGAEEAAGPVPLEEVFDGMRARASTTRGVDGRQQLALGRTYLAAGLVDQAVAAFKRAAHDAAVRTPASVALGEIFEEQQDFVHAIEWFERGADATAESEGERLDAMRRLALALEAANESARALAIWLEIQALHPEDSEAPLRVAKLSSPGAGR